MGGRALSAKQFGLLSAAGVASLFGVWTMGAVSGAVPAQFLPPPWAVIERIVELTQKPFAGFTLQQHLGSSVLRYLLGFALAAAVGVPLGLLMGWFRRLDYIVSPLFEGIRFIAPIAWVPFAALWFGTGVGGPTLIIFMGAFPPALINAYRGAKFVEPHLIEAAQTLGASGWRIIVEVLLPASVPSIVAGLRISAGLGWQSLIGAELIVASSGIGYLIVKGQSSISTATVMAGMIAIGTVGLIIDVSLRRAEAAIHRRRGR
jgi:ABC-type nitrate/sulfonate/bicarbonate transport system permease component